MGLFDEWLQDSGPSPPWGRIAATFLTGLQTAQQGGRQVVEQLVQWGALLTRNAATQWSQYALHPTHCAAENCVAQALVPCAVCGKTYCLGHVLVSYRAEGLCESCALRFVSQERKHKSSKDIVAAARKVLRLSEDATWEDVRDAYRAMAAEHHPDKQRSAAGRAKAEKRMKEINAAYATLKLHFEQAA